MPNRPSVSARDMIAAVDKLCAENAGAFPAPHAVRDEAKGGSQARAESAILTVQIRQGMTPHLRGTLPADFQAELPPASAIASLAPTVLADLPCHAQTAAEQCFAALGVAFKMQVNEIRALHESAVGTFVEQTTAMHERLMVAARHADDQERIAREDANCHTAEIAQLRGQLTAAQSDIRVAERELNLRTEMHEAAITDVRAAALVSDERLSARIELLNNDLASERDARRTSELALAGLTACADALREENTRLAAELASWRGRETIAATVRRDRKKVAAR